MSKKTKRTRPKAAPPARRFPWPWLAVAGALLLILGSAALVLDLPDIRPAGSGSPRLLVEETVVDEGYVRLNTMVRSTFRLSNVGDQTLQIKGEPWVELVEGC